MLEFFSIVAIETIYALVLRTFILRPLKERDKRIQNGVVTWKESFLLIGVPLILGFLTWGLCQLIPEEMIKIIVGIYLVCGVLSIVF